MHHGLWCKWVMLCSFISACVGIHGSASFLGKRLQSSSLLSPTSVSTTISPQQPPHTLVLQSR